MLTTVNATKWMILILTSIWIQIEVIQIKGHWIAGGNVKDEISKLGTERAELIFELSEYKDTTGRWKVLDITIISLKKLKNIFRRNNDNKRATGKRNG